MQGLLPYLIRRLLWAPFVLFAVSFIAFVILRFGPGDPVSVAAGQRRDPEAIERVKIELGLDKPFYEQYALYMKDLVTKGDLGESYTRRGIDVSELVFPKMWVSAQIGLVALLITFAIGIPVGIFAATRQGTWLDPLVIGTSLFFHAVPVLVTIPLMLLVFALKLDWLPAAGWGCSPRLQFMPQDFQCIGIFSRTLVIAVVALSLPAIAGVARLTRAVSLSVLGEDYVRTARAKGLSEFTVIRAHVVRNTLLPLTTVIGISLVGVLEGAFFAETLLGIPGIGRLAFESIPSRDYNVILGITLILAFAFIIANIVIDIAYTFIDPRVRYDTDRRG